MSYAPCADFQQCPPSTTTSACPAKLHVIQVPTQLPPDLVAELSRQLRRDQQHKQGTTALLSTAGSILPDATLFLPGALAHAAAVSVSPAQLYTADSSDGHHMPNPDSSCETPAQQDWGERSLDHQGIHEQHQCCQHLTDVASSPRCVHHHGLGQQSTPGNCAQRHMPPLCVEIKPKWGLLPSSPAIAAKHEIKKRISRFQLHQKLKLSQVGCIAGISAAVACHLNICPNESVYRCVTCEANSV